ncbi:hypothetical protein [Variovorax sp. AFSI2.2]|uniref:hypothetical protein n=1 Tax=Variovorax sp. AFSI2.2 TaxID=3384160 RepID=UPI003EB9418A
MTILPADTDTISRIFEQQLQTSFALRDATAAERVRKLARLSDALLQRREALHVAFQADLCTQPSRST